MKPHEAALAVTDPDWQPVDSAPYGMPVQVRDSEGTGAVAIRDFHCAWYNESRSAPLAFTPAEWSPLA